MNKPLPNKWVRKAFFDAFNGTSVDGQPIRVFDSRIPVIDAPNGSVLMDIQSTQVDRSKKCEDNWQTSLTLSVVAKYPLSGNTGSRLFTDNIADAIRSAVDPLLVLDPTSNLTILTQSIDFVSDSDLTFQNSVVYFKTIRLDFYIV